MAAEKRFSQILIVLKDHSTVWISEDGSVIHVAAGMSERDLSTKPAWMEAYEYFRDSDPPFTALQYVMLSTMSDEEFEEVNNFASIEEDAEKVIASVEELLGDIEAMQQS